MRDWELIRKEVGPKVWQTIYRIVNHHSDALDCYQDVMIEAYQKDRMGGVTNLPGLLRWLAVRRSLDLLRTKNRKAHQTRSAEPIAELASEVENAGRAMELDELMDRLRSELGKISQNHAEAFWLCCVEQQSYEEAAAHMNTDKTNIGVWVHRAREELRVLMDDIKPTNVGAQNLSPNQKD